MRRRTFLDDDRQRELEQRGFTVVRLVEEDEVPEVLQAIQALEPDDRWRPTLANYHCTFLDTSREYKQAVDDLTRGLFEERTCALLDDFRMLTSNLYVKPPGTGRFEVHQNWPVTDDIRDTTLTLWCPFVDAGPHNGGIQVVPGSHKLVPDVYTVKAPKYFAGFYDELIDHWLEPVSLKAGECLLFDDSLLHWSEENTSDQWRWSAQLVFMPKEKTPVIYYYDAEHDPPQLELYEVGPEFFIDHGVEQLLNRPTDLPYVGSVPETNLVLTEEQFAQLMRDGDRIRARVYDAEPLEEAFSDALALVGSGAPGAASAPAEASPAPEPPARRRRRWWR